MNLIKIEEKEFRQPTVFGIDWTEWLRSDSIAASHWTTSPGLLKGDDSATSAHTQIFLTYTGNEKLLKVENTITTVLDVRMSQTIAIEVTEK